MEQKIKLQHPQGKKAVSISTDKYEMLKKHLIGFLSEKTQGTFSEISKAVAHHLEKKKLSLRAL